jgi:hypothetical protein
MPVRLVFWGLAGGHRTPSEQRIIAANTGPSTANHNFFADGLPASRNTRPRRAAQPKLLFSRTQVSVTLANFRLPTW